MVIVFTNIAFPGISLSQADAGPDKTIGKGCTEGIRIGGTGDPSWCYTWSPSTGIIDGDIHNPNPIVKPDATQVYTLKVVESNFKTTTDEVKVTVVEVAAIEGLTPYVCLGKEIELTARLKDDADIPEGCEIVWNGNGVEFINSSKLSVKAKFFFCEADIEVTARFQEQDKPAKGKTTVVGFAVKLIDKSANDGQPARVILEPYPPGVPVSELKCFDNVKFTSKLASSSFGNIRGVTDLEFDPFNASFESRIANAIWYSTGIDNCNRESEYVIGATANVDGLEVNAQTEEYFRVFTINDASCNVSDHLFEGTPEIIVENSTPGKYIARLGLGSFKRDVKATTPSTNCPPTSQFYEMINLEENEHQTQIEDPNGIFRDLWNTDDVFFEANKRGPFIASAAVEAEKLANDAFNQARKYIERRDNIKSRERKCLFEKEAKASVGWVYRYTYKCTYVQTDGCPL